MALSRSLWLYLALVTSSRAAKTCSVDGEECSDEEKYIEQQQVTLLQKQMKIHQTKVQIDESVSTQWPQEGQDDMWCEDFTHTLNNIEGDSMSNYYLSKQDYAYEVTSQYECQQKALADAHPYYEYCDSGNCDGLCRTYRKCTPRAACTGTYNKGWCHGNWKVYQATLDIIKDSCLYDKMKCIQHDACYLDGTACKACDSQLPDCCISTGQTCTLCHDFYYVKNGQCVYRSTGKQCPDFTRSECCRKIDGRSGSAYHDEPCVPAQVGIRFTGPGGNVCEPRCWTEGGCGTGSYQALRIGTNVCGESYSIIYTNVKKTCDGKYHIADSLCDKDLSYCEACANLCDKALSRCDFWFQNSDGDCHLIHSCGATHPNGHGFASYDSTGKIQSTMYKGNTFMKAPGYWLPEHGLQNKIYNGRVAMCPGKGWITKFYYNEKSTVNSDYELYITGAACSHGTGSSMDDGSYWDSIVTPAVKDDCDLGAEISPLQRIRASSNPNSANAHFECTERHNNKNKCFSYQEQGVSSIEVTQNMRLRFLSFGGEEVGYKSSTTTLACEDGAKIAGFQLQTGCAVGGIKLFCKYPDRYEDGY